jgi:hypothetical protein
VAPGTWSADKDRSKMDHGPQSMGRACFSVWRQTGSAARSGSSMPSGRWSLEVERVPVVHGGARPKGGRVAWCDMTCPQAGQRTVREAEVTGWDVSDESGPDSGRAGASGAERGAAS